MSGSTENRQRHAREEAEQGAIQPVDRLPRQRRRTTELSAASGDRRWRFTNAVQAARQLNTGLGGS
ncbi:hypothetical protein [Nocardioides mesophilus]|uniref:Uncharacterized protein n=1 Tax=Nocardioides mesophilus TaxID=433659 RepID=A0A7G9REW6_9ACTN|nr:hypothetical protein [Nocardioides mesophilus]QNN54141.1 hypothetical protein H9L09_07170 [Nocardioides mesophilus]